MKMPLISVIVAVYNTSIYLSECLDSIIEQSYPNIEIICIDDGSKDNSLDVLKFYANKYDFIKIISQENLGQSAARNKGLLSAQGDYITFVDSDDIINKDLFKKVIKIFNEKKVDAVLYNMEMFFPNGNRFICFSGNLFPDKSMSLNSKKDIYCFNFTNAATCIFDRKSLNNKLVEGMIYEDWVFMIEYMSKDVDVFYLNEALYYYRRNFKKSTTSITSDRCFDLFKAYKISKDTLIINKKDFAVYINDLKIINEAIGFFVYNLLRSEKTIKYRFLENIEIVLKNYNIDYLLFLKSYLSKEYSLMVNMLIFFNTKSLKFISFQILLIHLLFKIRKQENIIKQKLIYNIKQFAKGLFLKLFPTFKVLYDMREILKYHHYVVEQRLNIIEKEIKKRNNNAE